MLLVNLLVFPVFALVVSAMRRPLSMFSDDYSQSVSGSYEAFTFLKPVYGFSD
jgi:hypothetical protein